MMPNEPADRRYGDDAPYDDVLDADGKPIPFGPTVGEILADLADDDEEPPASDA